LLQDEGFQHAVQCLAEASVMHVIVTSATYGMHSVLLQDESFEHAVQCLAEASLPCCI
jgi:hypothetical protein